jgi:hypothetical protein
MCAQQNRRTAVKHQNPARHDFVSLTSSGQLNACFSASSFSAKFVENIGKEFDRRMMTG